MHDGTAELLAAQDGDPRAFERFVILTHPDITRFCRYLNGDEDVDDLVQDTYLRALRSLGTYRHDAPATRWLLGIARRVCADAVEQRQRHRRPAPLTSIDTTADDTSLVELRDLLQAIDPSQRQAFVLTQLLGLSYDDTAGVCGCATGTIRSRVARARHHLSQLIDTAHRIA